MPPQALAQVQTMEEAAVLARPRSRKRNKQTSSRKNTSTCAWLGIVKQIACHTGHCGSSRCILAPNSIQFVMLALTYPSETWTGVHAHRDNASTIVWSGCSKPGDRLCRTMVLERRATAVMLRTTVFPACDGRVSVCASYDFFLGRHCPDGAH